MLFRAAASRSILRAASAANASSVAVRPQFSNGFIKASLTTSARASAFARPTTLALVARKPVTTALVRYSSTASSKAEEEHEVDMMAGVRNDVKTIKETFTIKDVPKDALYLGLAGVIPYVVTSAETFYLSWEMNHALTTGSTYLISGETAQLMMSVLEPIQIGYGAVILSFLGAVNWGFEWSGYGGRRDARRYATGVIAPAVAWPTLLMPVEYALISQFTAFTFLYYSDARASFKGLLPSWYAMYRFILTFVVGASIVLSLVGREQLATHFDSKHGIADKLKAIREQRAKDKAAAAAEAAGAAAEDAQ